MQRRYLPAALSLHSPISPTVRVLLHHLLRTHSTHRRCRRSQRGSISEFAATLFAVILAIFFLLNTIAVACGMAVLQLTAREASFKAATAHNLIEALDGMSQKSNFIAASGLGKFVKMVPIQGYAASGADLYINVTRIASASLTRYGPNTGIPVPIDKDANIYECSAQLSYDVGPLISFATVPVVKDIPGFGKPARMTSAWNIVLEHPEALSAANNAQNASNINLVGPPFSGIIPNSGNSTTGVIGGWNYPNAGWFTPMPGQIIYEQKDLVIPAQGPYPNGPVQSNWCDSQINIQPGNRISVAWNFHAMGQWTHNHNHPAYDADGQYQIWANMPTGALVGMISPGSGQQGLPFIIGKDFYNFSPRDTGRLYLRMNDGMYSDNNGQQTVTIWRTN